MALTGTFVTPDNGVSPVTLGGVTSGSMIVDAVVDAESAETSPDGPFAEIA